MTFLLKYPTQGGRFTELIYKLGKTRGSINEKPLLQAGAHADRTARVTENEQKSVRLGEMAKALTHLPPVNRPL